jgi:magnesium-transporting ATPase (P-type)
MIVTANLVQGVRQLRKQRVVVKRLDAVQNLGAM